MTTTYTQITGISNVYQNEAELFITGSAGPVVLPYPTKWYVQPASYTGSPRSDGTLGDISSTKDRITQLAGDVYPIVISSTSRFGGNLQWGTGPDADPTYPGASVNTSYISTPSNVESSASAWLKYLDLPNGAQQYAMGRVIKYQDGRLRFQVNSTDALVNSSPRVQWYTSAIIPKLGKYYIPLSVQFGDETTPWPTYSSGKDEVLWMQIKGSATQPIISATVKRDSPTSDTLSVLFNIKPLNSGSISQIATITGLPQNKRIDLLLEGSLEFDSTGYWKVWKDNYLVAQYSGNTMMSDFADNVQLMLGIYRFGWSTQAPENCAIIFHKAGILIGPK